MSCSTGRCGSRIRHAGAITNPESAIERQYTPAQIDALRKEERQSALRQVRIQAWIALVVTSAGALLLGWLIAGQTLAPIREITAHAQHASEETLDERIDLRGPPDEFKELADTFDSMLDRLQAAFESQRRFAAQASHELRTPLAIIRAESDVALAAPDVTEREVEYATSIRDAADRSERLVDGLLALARSESTLRDSRRVDLAELAGDVVGEQTDCRRCRWGGTRSRSWRRRRDGRPGAPLAADRQSG